MSKFVIAFTVAASFVCLVASGDIDGSYVIEVDLGDSGVSVETATNQPEQTLTISASDEGEYSATLTGGLVGNAKANQVKVEENEFSITFEFDVRGGTFEMTYSGEVENGEMTGTFSSGMGDFEFTGRLKEEDETNPEGESQENETTPEEESEDVQADDEKHTQLRAVS
ncbi:MAG: hypothetical protein F4Z01_08635 [Gammaproteobacteria bacterium]|nr:hypothetical protein [Gammaproteobacteria bacterium]